MQSCQQWFRVALLYISHMPRHASNRTVHLTHARFASPSAGLCISHTHGSPRLHNSMSDTCTPCLAFSMTLHLTHTRLASPSAQLYVSHIHLQKLRTFCTLLGRPACLFSDSSCLCCTTCGISFLCSSAGSSTPSVVLLASLGGTHCCDTSNQQR